MGYAADTLDILSEFEARETVGTLGQEQASNLSMAVTAVSRMIDDRFGSVVRRTVTAEIIPGWSCQVATKLSPVYSFTSVEESSGSTVTTLSAWSFGSTPVADAYYPCPWVTKSAPYSGTIEKRSGVFAEFVRVTYVAGRFADTASVDDRFKQAAAIALKNVWKAYSESLALTGEFTQPFSSFPTFGVPKFVVESLRDELLLPGIA